MTTATKKELAELLMASHLEFLRKLLTVCDETDKQEVKDLIYLNNDVGIGWGEGNYTPEQECDYFDRVSVIVNKYGINCEDYPTNTFYADLLMEQREQM